MADIADRIRAFGELMGQACAPKDGYLHRVPFLRLGDQLVEGMDELITKMTRGEPGFGEKAAELAYMLMVLSERQRESRSLSGPNISEQRLGG